MSRKACTGHHLGVNLRFPYEHRGVVFALGGRFDVDEIPGDPAGIAGVGRRRAG